MPEFIMPTEGSVERLVGVPPVSQSEAQVYGWITWRDLDAFTQGYLEALFFTECEPGTTPDTWDHERHSALHGDVSFGDIAPESLAATIADCAEWQEVNAGLLEAAYAQDGYSPEQAGSDYWFTRNGHGGGFWTREALEAEDLGDRLSDACRGCEVWAYMGDDGKVYLS